jgi:hypothetical protein
MTPTTLLGHDVRNVTDDGSTARMTTLNPIDA